MYRNGKRGKLTYSQEQIITSFFSLLEDKTYEQISISEICQKAQVARRTFYNNFNDKGDIIYLAVDSFFNGWKVLSSDRIDPNQVYRAAFEFVGENSQLFKLLYERNIFRLAESSLVCFFSADTNLRHTIPIDTKYKEYYFAAMLASFLSILSTWIKNNFREDIDTLVDLCHKLIVA